jgi:hypothetical protein
MGDKFVTEELLEEAMNGLVSKVKFQSDVDRLVSGLTDVNKAITALTTQLEEHIKKAGHRRWHPPPGDPPPEHEN